MRTLFFVAANDSVTAKQHSRGDKREQVWGGVKIVRGKKNAHSQQSSGRTAKSGVFLVVVYSKVERRTKKEKRKREREKGKFRVRPKSGLRPMDVGQGRQITL